MKTLLSAIAALASGAGVPLMYKPMPGGWHGVAPSACRGVHSCYRNRKVSAKRPHQGARECARRRKQMGVGEFSARRFAA